MKETVEEFEKRATRLDELLQQQKDLLVEVEKVFPEQEGNGCTFAYNDLMKVMIKWLEAKDLLHHINENQIVLHLSRQTLNVRAKFEELTKRGEI